MYMHDIACIEHVMSILYIYIYDNSWNLYSIYTRYKHVSVCCINYIRDIKGYTTYTAKSRTPQSKKFPSWKPPPHGRALGSRAGEANPCGSENCVFQKYGKTSQIIHFNRVFHYFHHPFWDTPIFGNTQMLWIRFSQKVCFWYLFVHKMICMAPKIFWKKMLSDVECV